MFCDIMKMCSKEIIPLVAGPRPTSTAASARVPWPSPYRPWRVSRVASLGKRSRAAARRHPEGTCPKKWWFLRLPYGNGCYSLRHWKWPSRNSWFTPFNMMIFHSFLYVYQRVFHVDSPWLTDFMMWFFGVYFLETKKFGRWINKKWRCIVDNSCFEVRAKLVSWLKPPSIHVLSMTIKRIRYDKLENHPFWHMISCVFTKSMSIQSICICWPTTRHKTDVFMQVISRSFQRQSFYSVSSAMENHHF